MKKGLFDITGEGVRKVIREALSPTFLIILLGSVLLWFSSKLNDNFETEIPVGIRIDGQKYRITAMVGGRGSDILAWRLSLKRRLSFTLDELSTSPSKETPGALVIDEASLAKAINGRVADIKVSQIVDIPEYMPPADETEEVAKTEAE